MRFKVLGCSGGIGGRDLHTTSFLVDEDVLIDAGTGVGTLPLEALAAIDHVFLTHSHLDHIACLPLMLDTVGDRRSRPVTVHATAETLAALRSHIFNNVIWPDFAHIPSSAAPYLRYAELQPGRAVDLDGRRFTPLPVNHGVPAVAYLLESGHGRLLFSGDTAGDDAFWQLVASLGELQHLVVEVAFPERDAWLARISRHIHPHLAAPALVRLPETLQVHITHTKPGKQGKILAELAALIRPRHVQGLQGGDVIDF